MKTDKECWEKYVKYNWVFNRINLFNVQHIIWAPFPFFGNNTKSVKIFSFDEIPAIINDTCDNNGSHIYIDVDTSIDTKFIETILVRGDSKKTTFLDSNLNITEIIDGTLELRNSSFITKYFSKFTGVVTFEFRGNLIISAHLRSLITHTDPIIIKLLAKIYNK